MADILHIALMVMHHGYRRWQRYKLPILSQKNLLPKDVEKRLSNKRKEIVEEE
ncbi:hypothetical protein DL98DRAFT_596674 [Cadophora sp. DSE1049]|nr:hypothetical protein DL98DRAFT_596674 [Cadophora sp. DSE1049]